MNERNRGNFVLNEARNVGDAYTKRGEKGPTVKSARLFNEVQEKICRLQPFDVLQNKSNIYLRPFKTSCMWNKNSLFLGLGMGLLLPTLGFLIIYFGYIQLAESGIVSQRGFSPYFRERTSAVIAICLNLIPLNAFLKRRATQSMRGIVLATILLVVLWVIYFGQYIIS